MIVFTFVTFKRRSINVKMGLIAAVFGTICSFEPGLNTSCVLDPSRASCTVCEGPPSVRRLTEKYSVFAKS